MEELVVPDEGLPTMEQLEAAYERHVQEGQELLDRGRAALRLLQDADAELSDGGEYVGDALVARSTAAYQLRRILRMFARAQIALIGDWDDRQAAAERVSEAIDQADRGDAPWKSAA